VTAEKLIEGIEHLFFSDMEYDDDLIKPLRIVDTVGILFLPGKMVCIVIINS